MADFRLDLRHAARVLRGSPASTITAILTLAIGIGTTTSIFSVVNGVVLHPLPFREDARLVSICERYPGSTPDWCGVAPPNIEDIAARSRTLDAIGIGREWSYRLVTPAGPAQIDGGLASPGFFRALGVKAERGRLIEESDLLGRPSTVALLTHESWQSRFGGRPDIVGSVVGVDRELVTIVGVIEPGFDVPRIGSPELWRPLHIDPRDEQHRVWRGFVSFGRLKDRVSIADARRELATLSSQLRVEHFASTPEWGLSLVSTRDLVVGGVRPMLFVFLGAVGVVLLIGCANVANILLARSAARSREMGLRAALGASPARIARALLVESGLLALAGGALGIALAFGATQAFKALAPASIPRIGLVTIDGRVLLFALGLSALTTFVFGLAPAIRGARTPLATSIREGGRGAAGHRGRLSAALVVAELALAVTLVASAGLLARSFVTLTAWRPGFDRERVLTFSIFAPTTTYSGKPAMAALLRRLESEIGALPGVTSVATASAGPLFGGRETWEMEVAGTAGVTLRSVRWYDASPSYFKTLGIPIVRGRALTEHDDNPDGMFVGVVNETLARRFWPDADPIGKTLVFGVGKERAEFHVVGVARDVVPLRPDQPVDPQLFWSNRQIPRPFTYFIVRTVQEPAALTASVRERLTSVDRELTAEDVRTLDERMQEELMTPRFSMLLVASFGLAALFFAAIGTYGLLSYVVSQRTREIGIRIALGAEPRKILGAVVRGGMVLALPGVLIGVTMTLAAGRLIRTMVVGVAVTDPITLGGAAVVLVAVAAIACFIPGWRASRVDPVVTLAGD